MEKVYKEAKSFVPIGEMLPNKPPGTQPAQSAQPNQSNPVPSNVQKLNSINPES